MSVFKDKGVVLKEYFSGEYDKNLVLLLKDRGKVTVFAKGARRPKSKYNAGSQALAYCEFVIFEGKGFLSLTQTEVISSFYYIGRDYDKLCLASYFAEIVNATILSSMPASDPLLLLLMSLKALAKGIMHNELISSIFGIKYMQIEGYSPQLDKCVICEEDQKHGAKLYFTDHGIICSQCAESGCDSFIEIDEKVIFVMDYILNNEIKKIFKISVSEEVTDKLHRAVQFFIKANLDVTTKSGKFIK